MTALYPCEVCGTPGVTDRCMRHGRYGDTVGEGIWQCWCPLASLRSSDVPWCGACGAERPPVPPTPPLLSRFRRALRRVVAHVWGAS